MLAEIELTGRRFGRWQVLSRSGERLDGRTAWQCRCDCGTVRAVVGKSLKRGISTNCGCVRSLKVAERNRLATQHGHAVNARPSRTYKSWRSMWDRCANPTHKSCRRHRRGD